MGVGIEIGDMMNKAVITVKPNDSIYKVASTMANTDIGGVVVVQNKEIKGIITEGDIISEIVSKKADPEKIKVSEIMKSPVKTIKKETDLEEAIKLMCNLNIERLPVVNDEGHLIGIVTERDMTKAEPGLIELLREKEAVTAMKTWSEEEVDVTGLCEECGDYSERLTEHNAKLLCSRCKETEF